MSQKKPEKTLEELISRLEEIASLIQSGDIGLEESIAYYEEGQQIAKECYQRLSAIQKKLDIITPSQFHEPSPDLPSDNDKHKDLGSDSPILLA